MYGGQPAVEQPEELEPGADCRVQEVFLRLLLAPLHPLPGLRPPHLLGQALLRLLDMRVEYWDEPYCLTDPV